MNYKQLSQIERYQISSLVKAQHSITQISSLIGRHKSTVSCGYRKRRYHELAKNTALLIHYFQCAIYGLRGNES
jgi:IS30 family transposase